MMRDEKKLSLVTGGTKLSALSPLTRPYEISFRAIFSLLKWNLTPRFQLVSSGVQKDLLLRLVVTSFINY